jgi:hypothetical protein
MDIRELNRELNGGGAIGELIDTPALNEKQKDIVRHWTHPDCLGVSTDFIVMPSGELACVNRYLFTHAITYGISRDLFEDRWCYHTYADALTALIHWYKNFDAMPEPDGWHRHPSSGRRVHDGHCEVRL